MAVERLAELPASEAFGRGLEEWPRLVLEVREANSKSLADDIDGDAQDDALDGDDRPMAVKRLEVTRDYLSGERRKATHTLSMLRDEAPTHLGLAADEALLLAAGREQLGAVASISEQLASRTAGLSEIDGGRVSLARAVVHLYSGDRVRASDLVALAWTSAAPWDRLSRDLALEVAVDAGAFELVDVYSPKAASQKRTSRPIGRGSHSQRVTPRQRSIDWRALNNGVQGSRTCRGSRW
jgi:hypothetical protein